MLTEQQAVKHADNRVGSKISFVADVSESHYNLVFEAAAAAW